MDNVILVINSGSSSIKFSLFTDRSDLHLIYHGEIEDILESPCITIFNASHTQIVKKNIPTKGSEAGLREFFNWLEQLSDSITLKAVGHRVVHGGRYFFQPTLVTEEVINKIAALIPLAPLHEPHNLEAIKIIRTLYPKLPQVACFDTTFHRTQEKVATFFAIPRSLTDEGVVRYGFHGISYEYIASILPKYIKNKADGRVIVAHLGNGASMCAMRERKSVATTMGFTPLDGLMMGARCGAIDPGVLLYLLQGKKLSAEKVNTLLYQESGLLGMSGISSDMRELEASTDPNAIEAVDLFCYKAARELCALLAILEGCEVIIFTAGIGENSAIIRKKICDRLQWLGVALDEKLNQRNLPIISQDGSSILVGVIPTNEEYMIARHTMNVVFN